MRFRQLDLPVGDRMMTDEPYTRLGWARLYKKQSGKPNPAIEAGIRIELVSTSVYGLHIEVVIAATLIPQPTSRGHC